MDVDSCASACNGTAGVRSEVLGVCTCAEDPGVDQVCNQACRKESPQLAFAGGTTVMVTDAKTGQAKKVDLLDAAASASDVFGEASCATGSNCTVRSAEVGPDGTIQGSYKPPALIQSAATTGRRLLGGLRKLDAETRGLQAVQADYALSLRNPVYCIREGDSFLFTITDPKHHPTYMKDSQLNTNKNFDYGAFLQLASEMRIKTSNANGAAQTSVFVHTFTQEGTYVFADALNKEKLMVINVMGEGESCTDPEKYVQAISSGTMSAGGVPQDDKIILRLDYPLVAGMAACFLTFIGVVLVLVTYCLHQQWTFSDLSREGYRLDNFDADIRHHSMETYGGKVNDFQKHCSHPPDEDSDEEDDVDDINMEIYQDLVEAGRRFLDTYNDAKDRRKKNQRARRKRLNVLL